MAVEIEHGPVLFCPYASCGLSFAMVPGLTLHLVEEHRRPHGEAFYEASRIQEKARKAAPPDAPAPLKPESVLQDLADEPLTQVATPDNGRLNGKAPRAARRAPAPPTPPPPTKPKEEPAVNCSTCGKPGHARSCAKKTTDTRSKPAATTVKPREAAPINGANGSVADHLRQLRADIERGQAAELELSEIRKLVGSEGR